MALHGVAISAELIIERAANRIAQIRQSYAGDTFYHRSIPRIIGHLISIALNRNHLIETTSCFAICSSDVSWARDFKSMRPARIFTNQFRWELDQTRLGCPSHHVHCGYIPSPSYTATTPAIEHIIWAVIPGFDISPDYDHLRSYDMLTDYDFSSIRVFYTQKSKFCEGQFRGLAQADWNLRSASPSPFTIHHSPFTTSTLQAFSKVIYVLCLKYCVQFHSPIFKTKMIIVLNAIYIDLAPISSPDTRLTR